MIDNVRVAVCEGTKLLPIVPDNAKKRQMADAKNPRPINIILDGTNKNSMSDQFIITEKLLSQHLLLAGGIGSGKTNTFNLIMSSIIPQLSSKDVMIIFDTKGDFYKEFYKPGDIVISNDNTAMGISGVDYWNIINELEDDDHLEENVTEVSAALFAEKLKKSGDNSFFPNAAKDLVTAILYHFVKVKNKIKSDNKKLSDCFKSLDHDWLLDLLSMYPQFEAMKSYIPKSAPQQAVGVLAEIQQVTRSLFIGNFTKEGTLSIRNLVRNKGGRKIFVEYDIGIGSTLKPIYTLLFDLAIKEALCRKKSEGNVFFIVDEFKLLPNLQHIDDAVNFGRSLGIKFMIGIQNIDQIIEAYNENMAMNIMSGFLNFFAFKVNDYSTREYIKKRIGTNRKSTVFKTLSIHETIDTANVVEDWDVASLILGQAVVYLNNSEPFIFRFKEYK